MNSTEEIVVYAVSNFGGIFSMGLGALCAAFMCWGFGRG